jgi:hypothetical protein
MKRVRALRTKASLFAGATLLAGLGIGAVASPAQAAAYDDCGGGEVCFYTGKDGTGKKCSWSGRWADWQAGAARCSWAATNNVKSIYNNGNSGQSVVYYTSSNFKDRIGCTKKGVKGNLAGTYKVRSHKWVEKC